MKEFESLKQFFEAYESGEYEPFNLQEEVEALIKKDTLSQLNANREFLNDMLEDSKSLLKSELLVIEFNPNNNHLEFYRIDTQLVFGMPCIPQDGNVYIDKWGIIH